MLCIEPQKGAKLNLHSVFISVDGEVNKFGQGAISTFVRLTGCNLRCSYCDTSYAWEGEPNYTVKEIGKEVLRFGCQKITITGGEPLLQAKNVWTLIQYIKYRMPEAQFTIETNGTIPPFDTIPLVEYVWFVVDYKLALGVETEINLMQIYGQLREGDWVKFVIGSTTDFYLAKDIAHILKPITKAHIAFSPVFGQIRTEALLELMIDNKLWDIKLNCQIHKLTGLQ
jgi:7-carboxy-7-deazaguanine synthase